MKNSFCELNEDQIKKLPERFWPYLFSKFTSHDGYVFVPDDTFKEMVDIVVELASANRDSAKIDSVMDVIARWKIASLGIPMDVIRDEIVEAIRNPQ